ncbi:unnamed protein product, partial [Symbiodinium pilosum]
KSARVPRRSWCKREERIHKVSPRLTSFCRARPRKTDAWQPKEVPWMVTRFSW